MIKLTKSQRHKRYKEALEEIKSGRVGYICVALQDPEHIPEIDTADVMDVFPEFAKRKPKNVGYVWFTNVDNPREERIKLLKVCVKETKPKSNGVSRGRGVSKRVSISPRKTRNNGRATVVRRTRKKSKNS